MDEILRSPKIRSTHPSLPGLLTQEKQAQSKPGLLTGFLSAAYSASVLLRRQCSRMFHRLLSAAADRPLVEPLHFLAVAAALGITVVVSSLYTPTYAVTVDGVMLGTVREPAVFERIADRVEARAGAILGYPYELGGVVEYRLALTRKDEVSSVSGFETYLFNQIGEVMKSYVLTVDGEFVGAAADEADLKSLLDRLKAPYLTENTIESSFVSNVRVTREYTATDVLQDLDKMTEFLTQNINGETSYEVVKGDTFMAIAYANDMKMDELKALNPEVNADKLSIGQLLTVKETIPYLSVRTLDRVVYKEPIPCPVKEVEDASMYQGETKVLDPGVPGESLVHADITYINGRESGRVINETSVLSEATTRVVAVGTKARPSWYPNGYFIWPCSGNITSKFGYRSIFGSYSFHSGIDIASSYGTSIRASDGGTVTFAGWKGSYGRLVIVDHGNGYQTYYGHCSSLLVSSGSKVYQGQTIAKMGSTGRSTGNHCHFELRVSGTAVNPRSYLP